MNSNVLIIVYDVVVFKTFVILFMELVFFGSICVYSAANKFRG